MTAGGSGPCPSGISAITPFVEDVRPAKQFYGSVFGLPVHYEDADSAVLKFGDTLVNPPTRAKRGS